MLMSENSNNLSSWSILYFELIHEKYQTITATWQSCSIRTMSLVKALILFSTATLDRQNKNCSSSRNTDQLIHRLATKNWEVNGVPTDNTLSTLLASNFNSINAEKPRLNSYIDLCQSNATHAQWQARVRWQSNKYCAAKRYALSTAVRRKYFWWCSHMANASGAATALLPFHSGFGFHKSVSC